MFLVLSTSMRCVYPVVSHWRTNLPLSRLILKTFVLLEKEIEDALPKFQELLLSLRFAEIVSVSTYLDCYL